MSSDSTATPSGEPRRERPSFAARQNVALVKRHLLVGVAVSELCDEAPTTPTQFYW